VLRCFTLATVPFLCFYCPPAPRDLHSFPTRRSSDLVGAVVPDPAEVIDGLLEAGPVPRHAQRQRGGVARDVPGHPVPESRSRRGVGIEAGHREGAGALRGAGPAQDRKSTRLNSSHVSISYAVFCLKKNSDRV